MRDLSKFNNQEFQRGASKWKEGLWWLLRSLLFAPWFPLPSSWKVVALRGFGAKVGEGVVIRSRVNITFPWKLVVGDHVWIGDEVMILSLDEVMIGANTCISQRAFLCTGSHDFSKEGFDLITGPIEIGAGCWVGAQSFVGPGVTMGQGSRCLAGSVVVKSVGEGATVGGVPAKSLTANGADSGASQG
ncbi:WcaF family extracellular polysaccharide biosynthesis acetyltransferase [bacterium]|nr:WcaF family extracellular polysaccharide biosynthesis acetyltransferase [bacterium]